MNSFKIAAIILLTAMNFANAQDLEQAKKAIDAEQFEKAKSILKSIIKSKPSNGKAAFFLGNIYFNQTMIDSAKTFFQSGLLASDGGKFNNIGLGQIELENGNITAAENLFTLATKDMKKKDFEENIYIARAYMNISKPDFKKALTFLSKATLTNPTDAQIQLALGDAHFGDKNQNDSFIAYRNAFQTDNTLIRAKMQLGVLIKGAKNYEDALKSFDEVIAVAPQYGPVYREMAETYYKWARNKPSKSAELLPKALENYTKYMGLTDYSINSRMRYADFLILLKEYKALEAEAKKMIELDKVNPRIYRYLGYSAYENGNLEEAQKSLESFTNNPSNKIIARDYFYLGLIKIKKASSADGLTMDSAIFESGLSDLRKGFELAPILSEEFNELGKKLFQQKMYKEAASLLEIGLPNKESKNYLDDCIYYGLSLYYDNNKTNKTPDPAALTKADAAFANVIAVNPKYTESYYYRARVNALLENNEVMKQSYEEYIAKTSEKGAEEVAKPTVKKKFVESYNNIASTYLTTDKTKAKEIIAKSLEIDPTDKRALEMLEFLK